ncbi:MAG TPA: carbohydrate kinase family protein [Pyrinomonadaceae bacterium]|nr:carbohydrate kinase family protein [Pyrinomonadaceae bacterium]
MRHRAAIDGSIVVIGELNVDAVATGLTETPRLGAEILAEDFQLTLGSASAIFASGVARLGHEVTFISKVGRDDFGDFCLAALRNIGISTRHVLRDSKEKTGITLALSTRKDRALVTYLGTISTLKYDDVRMPLLKGKSHLHLTSYFLQHGLRASFPRIFEEAHAQGLTTSFDPNSDPTSSWADDIWDVLTHTDIFFLNQTEALQLTKQKGARGALKALSARVPCAVIKLGPKGAVAIKDGQVASVPGFKVDALDTTGAGDSFAAGFVSAFLKGQPLEECLRSGNACGALSTLKAGGTANQPDRAGLKRFLSRSFRGGPRPPVRLR